MGGVSGPSHSRLQRREKLADPACDVYVFDSIFNSALSSLLTHVGHDISGSGIIQPRNEFQKKMWRGTPDGNWVQRVWRGRAERWGVLLWLTVSMKTVVPYIHLGPVVVRSFDQALVRTRRRGSPARRRSQRLTGRPVALNANEALLTPPLRLTGRIDSHFHGNSELEPENHINAGAGEIQMCERCRRHGEAVSGSVLTLDGAWLRGKERC